MQQFVHNPCLSILFRNEYAQLFVKQFTIYLFSTNTKWTVNCSAAVNSIGVYCLVNLLLPIFMCIPRSAGVVHYAKLIGG